jgi:hypothetical protein
MTVPALPSKPNKVRDLRGRADCPVSTTLGPDDIRYKVGSRQTFHMQFNKVD